MPHTLNFEVFPFEKHPYLNQGTRIKTEDDIGTIVDYELRKNTNGGLGI